MTRNPFVNAGLALGYILLVVGIMNLMSQNLRNKPDTFLAPVVFLSLLTLSVSVMACLFFYRPLQMFVSDMKNQAVLLFVKTVAVFAVLTSFVVGIVVFQLIK